MSTFIWTYLPRNDYESIGVYHRNKYATAKAFVSTSLICILMGLMMFALWNLILERSIISIHYLNLNKDTELLHSTSDKFLSFGIDSSLLRETRKFPLNDERFVNLAKYLSPAYVRIGGTAADCLYFNETMVKPVDDSNFKFNPNNITNFTINGNDFISLNEFASNAGLRLIFDLNVLLRHPNNTWDSSNANQIISFAKLHNFDLDWQLGNEPNSFRHVFNRQVSGQQLAEDYKILRQLLNNNGYKKSAVFGPETNHIGDSRNSGVEYSLEFFKNIDNNVNYLTWHQYYLNGREARAEDFINVTIFNYLPQEIQNYNQVFEKTNRSLPTCLSETSTAYGGGAPDLSDRYVAGFLWLDKLGFSAAAGIKVVTRQSFYGGNYAMVGPDMKPNPDWWISVLFKQLVSEKVLSFKIKDVDAKVRMYAHCTPKKALLNRVPAATVFGINLHQTQNINVALGGEYDKDRKMFVYIFESYSLQSREILLNGEILNLKPDGSLPPFNPNIYSMDEIISLPPLSMFFIVVHGTEVSVCDS